MCEYVYGLADYSVAPTKNSLLVLWVEPAVFLVSDVATVPQYTLVPFVVSTCPAVPAPNVLPFDSVGRFNFCIFQPAVEDPNSSVLSAWGIKLVLKVIYHHI